MKPSSTSRTRQLGFAFLTSASTLIAVPWESPTHLADPPRLFAGSPDTPSAPITQALKARSAPHRILQLNPEIDSQTLNWFQAGQSLHLDLLENQNLTLQLTEVRTAPDGALELLGESPANPGSHAHLILLNGEVSGTAFVPGLGSYDWVPTGTGASRLTRRPTGRILGCATPDFVRSTAKDLVTIDSTGVVRTTVEDGRWDPGTEPTVIDVLILYTPSAVTAQGDEESLRRGIQGMVDSANASFLHSRVGVRLNPVFSGLLSGWTESGSIVTESGRIAEDSRVATLRNDYQADLVYLVAENDNFGYTGVAYMLPTPKGNSRQAFAVMRRSIFAGNPRSAEFQTLTFTHETGHMLGAGHDREHGYPSPFSDQPPAYSYGNGYRFEVGGITYRTAMGYDPGVQLSLFSHPDLTFDGVPLGVPAGQPGEADNAQTINRTAPFVARYRNAQSRIGFEKPTLLVSESGNSVSVPLIRTGDLNTAAQVTVTVDSSSTAKAGQDFGGPLSAVISFATNQATAEWIIPLIQDEMLEGDETLKLRLSKVSATHGLAPQSSCVITLRDDEPAIVVTPSTGVATESGGETEFTVEFTGTLAEGARQEVIVEVGQTGDTALAQSDYTVAPTTLTFTAEQRRQIVRLRALPDTEAETDESLRLRIGNATVTARILDDDRAGTLLPIAQPNGPLSAVEALPQGGALVAGEFTAVDGLPRTGLTRLNPDGSVDPGFLPPTLLASPIPQFGVPPAKINCLLSLANGRIVAGGFIGLVNGKPARNLIRMQADGTLDPTFQHPGMDGAIWTLVEQPDGKILVGGAFDHVGNQSLRGLVRLNPDGSLDSGFSAGFGGTVVFGAAVGLLPEGKLLVGGHFETQNGRAVSELVRLHADGSLDTTFPLLATGASALVTCVSVGPDGRAYVGGYFDLIGGRSIRRLARLKADGSLDLTFRAPQPNGEVISLVPLPNGQLWVGGMFSNIGGVSRRYVALLNEDGTVDQTFDGGRGAGDHVWTVSASGDGSLYVGGALRSFNDQPVSHLARLRLPPIPGSLIRADLDPSGALRGVIHGLPGARYPLESSTDLINWQSAGEIRMENRNVTAPFQAPTESPARFFRLATPK